MSNDKDASGGAEPQFGCAGNAEPQLGRATASKNAKLRLSAPGGGPAGWYSRGYLPHYNNTQTLQSVTFRLADSLPQSKLQMLERELRNVDAEKFGAIRRKKIEVWLDEGMGCCALRHPALAALMQETLLKFDGDRYRLIAWCIMPNHVHVILETRHALSKIVQSWKSYTGRWALENNAEFGMGIPGKALWMREYWDRYIRSGAHFENVIYYIERNPVTAGLCEKPSDWAWSSAKMRSSPMGTPIPNSAL